MTNLVTEPARKKHIEMPSVNRRWIMAKRPKGNDIAAALELTQAPVPELRDGEVLIRNGYLSMDAGTRMWMTDRQDSYQPPLPVGSPMIGQLLGVVVDARHPDFRAGDLVRAFGQWADFSIVHPDQAYLARLSWRLDDLRQYLGVFGFTGWTAYLGVIEEGRAQPGETFLVSAAAGAIGVLAGQIAKNQGCRVIGIAGSDDKCAWIQRELRFDAAINYKTQNVEAELKRLCPDGVNLYFDNVGGPLLDAVLPHMALHGRVAICGLIAQYDKDGPVPGPYRFDQVLMKRLTISGFFVPDQFHRGAEFEARLRPWYTAGKLIMPFDVTDGLEHTVAAYTKLFTGANRGKTLVKVCDVEPC